MLLFTQLLLAHYTERQDSPFLLAQQHENIRAVCEGSLEKRVIALWLANKKNVMILLLIKNVQLQSSLRELSF